MNSAPNSNFQPGPTTIGDLIARTTTANVSGTHDTYNIAIGARVDQSTPIGTYSKTFVVRLVSNAVPYSFTYDDGVVTNMPADVVSEASSSTTAISSNVPVRDGYTFLGWCTGTVTSSGGTDTCTSGTVVQAGGTVATASASNDYHFTAMWEKVMPTIQSYTLSTCSTEASGTNVTVKDARDNNTYTVKYINGECWMTQNLRFQDTSLSTTTSNVTSDKTLTYYDLEGTEGSSSSGHCYTTGSSGRGFSNACKHDSGNTTTGVWYNYYAATAGTVSGNSSYAAATQDICPKNWHLPSGPSTTSNTDFNKLVGNTTSGWQDPTVGLTAFGAVAGGNYAYGSLNATGYGSWWSATVSNATNRYRLRYNSSNGLFSGDDNSYRDSGYFVRCVRSS